jgi:hypothetical protein
MNAGPMTPYDDAPPRPRRAVASYANYQDAERAVDYLAENKLPIERVAIVGRDLRVVEQVTGRMTALEAAIRGALVGAVTGMAIAWLFELFSWFDPRIAWGWLIFDGFWFGALVGTAFGLLMYLATSTERHFASVSAMQPSFFDIVVDEDYADDAARMLAGFPLPSRVSVQPPSTVASAPPRAASPTPVT